MIMHSARFVISAVSSNQYPQDDLPEIALVGRSNVGKSSLINSLIQRKNLARTSAQPGKTQTLNYYNINESMYFVDLPGYGYAHVSQDMRKQWGRMIDTYITQRKPLCAVMLLIDLRHAPMESDIAMFRWLTHYNIRTCVVATKADKISRSKRMLHAQRIQQQLDFPSDFPFFVYSAVEHAGRDALWAWIESVGTARVSRVPKAEVSIQRTLNM
jgi:GTP-binding protein